MENLKLWNKDSYGKVSISKNLNGLPVVIEADFSKISEEFKADLLKEFIEQYQ